MSAHITIDEQSGDEPIVLAIDGHEAPMTRPQAIAIGEALIEIARNREGITHDERGVGFQDG